MAGKLAKSHFICFDLQKTLHSGDVLLHYQPSFCSTGLSFELCPFGCSLFCRLFAFRDFLNKQTLTQRQRVQWQCGKHAL